MGDARTALTVGLAILNGLFSPALALVYALQGLWYPFFLPAMLPLVLLFSALITATLTLMIAGVPAALYERYLGSKESDGVSGWLWFAATLVLTIPALPQITAALGLAR